MRSNHISHQRTNNRERQNAQDNDRNGVVPMSKRQQAAAWAAQRNKQQQPDSKSGVNQVSLRMRAARTSGKLDLTGLGLALIPDACFDAGGGTLDGDEEWWALAEITAFILRDNQVTALHPLIANYAATLEILDCANNSISIAPRECFNLPQLRRLVLSRNCLQSLDLTSGGTLNSLAVLEVTDNELLHLPSGNLPGLLSLNASNNHIEELTSFEDCPKLQRLNVARNRLVYVTPRCFDPLTQLTELDLSNNSLTQLDADLGALVSLRVLDLSYNKFASLGRLPTDLDQCMLAFNRLTTLEGLKLHCLKTLSTLNISDNKIGELPESLGQCVALQALDASNNDMRSIPATLGHLSKLTRISLQGNPLKTIRRALVEGGTENLKRYLRTRGGASANNDQGGGVGGGDESLGIGGTSLGSVLREAKATGLLSLSRNNSWQTLPVDVSQMLIEDTEMHQRLLKVVLSHNALVEFPTALLHLRQLQHLDLADNALVDIPAELLVAFPLLFTLTLCKNRLDDHAVYKMLSSCMYDASLGSKLEALDLSQNVLMAIPTVLPVSLINLNLSFNKITDGSTSRLELPNTTSLNLSNNKLTAIPHALVAGSMPALESLDVENNNIGNLPPELALLPRLVAVSVIGNPQRTVRLAVVNKGPRAVVDALRFRLPVGSNAVQYG